MPSTVPCAAARHNDAEIVTLMTPLSEPAAIADPTV
jgi:hypothetical protein